MAYKKAHFKTGHDQREIIVDAIVTEELEVGSICTYDASTKKLTGASAASNGSYIVAQSDMSLEYGHIPVENRDYRYSSAVAVSTTEKKVALFLINDATDIIVMA